MTIKSAMKLHDYPEPDSLSIEFTDAPGTKEREIVERLGTRLLSVIRSYTRVKVSYLHFQPP